MMDDLDAYTTIMKKICPPHEHDDHETMQKMMVEDKIHPHIYLGAELPSCPDP
jgi:hypothetical protein